MVFLDSPFTGAAFNLAMEEYAFSCLSRGEEYFMLWQNDSSVILGKHQNAQEEVNLPYAKAQGIPVVRRLSGGGAVYHDLGNLNFTWITDGESPHLPMERFTQPLLTACRSFGINARIDGRNDVTVDGRKFSGGAGYQQDGRTMHHGTVLISSDLKVMARVLTPSMDKIRSDSARSVPSRVINLADRCSGLTVQAFAGELRRQVLGPGTPRHYRWTPEDLRRIEELCQTRYDTWDWNFGHFPEYQVERRRRVEDCGTVQVGMQVVGGKIADISITGDFFGARPVGELERSLRGRPLRYDALLPLLTQLEVGRYLFGMPPEIFASLLCGETR